MTPMKRLVFALLAVVSLVAMPAVAQEGHPLKGSWLGTWKDSRGGTGAFRIGRQ